jgi:hypothetical protein
MTTLAAAIDADDELLTVDTLPPSPYVQADDELIEIRATFPEHVYLPTNELLPARIRVNRGVAGTTAASHADGATLTPVYAASAGGGGGLTNPVTEELDIQVAGDTALVAESAGGTVTLGTSDGGGAELSVHGTDPFSGAVVLVTDMDQNPDNQYVSILSIGQIRVAAVEENGTIYVTSEEGTAFVQAAKADESKAAMLSTNKGVSMNGITSAPSDGSLAAGELMIKAKQANGTVVTGSVNLT